MGTIRLYTKCIRFKKSPQAYYVYDATIANLEERNLKRLRFESATRAAEFLGISNCSRVNDYCNSEAIISKKKYYSHRLKKTFVIRKATD